VSGDRSPLSWSAPLAAPAPGRRDSVLGLSPSGFHRISYTEYGDPANPHVVVCAHGLTRNAHDFDYLADRLSARFRLVCVDVVGRGESDWLPEPSAYGYPQYLADMATLLARVHAEQVDWIGTSMGGLIGTMLAAQPGTPIRKLVINDIGPFVPRAALKRIATYVGTAPEFASMDEAEQYIRTVYAQYGPLSDEQWAYLARHSVRSRPGGAYAMHYDPNIRQMFTLAAMIGVDIWQTWDRVRCPVLVLRGEDSDLLLPETALKMGTRGPLATVVEIGQCGHAPALFDPAHIDLIGDWLSR